MVVLVGGGGRGAAGGRVVEVVVDPVVVVVGAVVVVRRWQWSKVVVDRRGGRRRRRWSWSRAASDGVAARPVGGRGRAVGHDPGAPPVRVVSVAVMAVVPFSAKVRVEPVALRVRVVPAASALPGRQRPAGPVAVVPQEQHQLGAAAVPEVDADVEVGPPAWARTAGPIHWPPVSWVEVTWTWDDWSLE